MDESIQKQIEASLPKLQQAEHWAWKYPPESPFAGPDGFCVTCRLHYPQSRSECIGGHLGSLGQSDGEPVRVQ